MATQDGDSALDLGDIFPEPARPPTPEPTYETYTRPDELSDQAGTKWKELKMRLVGQHPLWGHHLWNAARSFATFLDRNSEVICKGKRLLELGAGAGLPSLVAALCGAEKVVITDYPDAALIENMIWNMDNCLPPSIRGNAVAKGFLWGAPSAPLLAALGPESEPQPGNLFDVVLLSDLVFNHSQHGALLKTCDQVLSRRAISAGVPNPSSGLSTPCVLVFYTHHRPKLAHRDLEFFRLAEDHGWICREIVTEKMDAMFAEDPGDVEVRSTIHGWILYGDSSRVGSKA